MKNGLLKDFEMQAVGAAGAYGILFLLLGLVFFGGVGSVGAGRVGVFPWEVAVVIAVAMLVGALLLGRVHVRTAVEIVLGLVLFLGAWLFCWYAFGEPGLVVAGVVTLAQAFYRMVWIHDLFVLIGAAGAVLYMAFLFPALTWAILLLGLALSDAVGGRAKRTKDRLTQSVIHRGILPALLIPPAFLVYTQPLVQVLKEKRAWSFGMVELLFPGFFVAHAALLGGGAFGLTVVTIMAVAGWVAWKRVEAPLLPLALAAMIPYVLFAFFV